MEEHGIYQVGRYGRWIFQGIADSIKDGFFAGASFKELALPEKTIHLPTAKNVAGLTLPTNGSSVKPAKVKTPVKAGNGKVKVAS